ncbi:DUF2817 domain-containing protein [Mesonia aquimarina]|uniref:DUF2817 domain-containing protein n=1 Tax=Mesonia aquimarina TaxID=1504967 RepID=UPI000EF6054C|nr:DUF2817 domain-containing protein [Mesonia aquimarina]
MKVKELLDDYSHYKNVGFEKRYLDYSSIKNYINQLKDLAEFEVDEIGLSVNKESIFSIKLGRGKTKIFMWSQMHGNESTTTKAVLDLLLTFQHKKYSPIQEFLENCTLLIIPVLNPDGLTSYTRVNANNVDLNRDAINLSQPESKILQRVFNSFHPDFCFNLHDQRTIFSAGNTAKSACVSFLAPAFNEERSVNKTRERAMQLIAVMSKALQEFIPNKMGRYDDSFNLNCVGDFFQSKNSTTILFEAGHVNGDYQREETRKLIFVSMINAIESIIEKSYSNFSVEDYELIPENEKLFYDCIIRNVKFNGQITDVAIQYEERLENKAIRFIPKLEKVGDLHNFFGHKEFKGKNKELAINNVTQIDKLGIDIQHINLGNEDIFTNLTIS